jgi:hypothetical protein
MESRIALFLSISWVVLQWAVVAFFLVLFYPLKVLFRQPAEKSLQFPEIDVILPVSILFYFKSREKEGGREGRG